VQPLGQEENVQPLQGVPEQLGQEHCACATPPINCVANTAPPVARPKSLMNHRLSDVCASFFATTVSRVSMVWTPSL